MDLLSALQGAGEAIDKGTGGRAVRGLLAGKPRELLSPIPYSDSLGLTDRKDATSGRDLTDAYNLTTKGDNSFGSHAAGFLADNVLSPANMLGGYGAFKAAPSVAKGITSGAKALSGLDMFENIAKAGVGAAKGVAAGARAIRGSRPLDGLANFGRAAGSLATGEAGYLKVPPLGVPRELADAADALGPMYPGGIDKLNGIAKSIAHLDFEDSSSPYRRMLDLAKSEHADRLANELPAGSKFLGNGAEALAFKTPDGNVVRIADNAFGAGGRNNIPEILQPYRYTKIGPYTAEHLPFVEPLSGSAGDQIDASIALQNRLKSRQYEPWDAGPHNMGVTKEGNYIIHDGGAVGDEIGYKSRGMTNPYLRLPMPDEDTVAKLMEMGSPELVRKAIADGAAMGSEGQGVTHSSLFDALKQVFTGTRRAGSGFFNDESGYLKVPLQGVPDNLRDAADALGPMYPGGTDKLLSMKSPGTMFENMTDSGARHLGFHTAEDRARMIAESEFGGRIANEIPQGSSILGSGGEALALRTPAGYVIRISSDPIKSTARLNSPEILQPFRHANIGPYTVEHLPYVKPIDMASAYPHGLPSSFDGGPPMRDDDVYDTVERAFNRLFSDRDLDSWDISRGNLGATKEGKWTVLDGGAVRDPHGVLGGSNSMYSRLEMPNESQAQELVDLGSHNLVRRSLEEGDRIGTTGQGIDPAALMEWWNKGDPLHDKFQSVYSFSKNAPPTPIYPDFYATFSPSRGFLGNSMSALGRAARGFFAR